MNRICQHCAKWYRGTTQTHYCSTECKEMAEWTRNKIRRLWNKTQNTLTIEERRRELDEILGIDE
jgi:hypothetical protein